MNLPPSNEYFLPTDPEKNTSFQINGDQIFLRRLCGLVCANSGEENRPNRTRGLALVCTSEGRFEGVDLKVSNIYPQPDGFKITRQAGALVLESVWTICPQTGIL